MVQTVFRPANFEANQPNAQNGGNPDPVQTDEANPRSDGTPVGLNNELLVRNGQVRGTDQADRITLSDLARDRDQIINAGAGDDIFNFNGSESRLPTSANINGIVDMGTGIDTVFLGFQITDYQFTLRSDGGIKIQYVSDEGGVDGAAVTFRNADLFTFRNFDDQTGTNFQTYSLTADELRAYVTSEGGFNPQFPPADGGVGML